MCLHMGKTLPTKIITTPTIERCPGKQHHYHLEEWDISCREQFQYHHPVRKLSDLIDNILYFFILDSLIFSRAARTKIPITSQYKFGYNDIPELEKWANTINTFMIESVLKSLIFSVHLRLSRKDLASSLQARNRRTSSLGTKWYRSISKIQETLGLLLYKVRTITFNWEH